MKNTQVSLMMQIHLQHSTFNCIYTSDLNFCSRCFGIKSYFYPSRDPFVITQIYSRRSGHIYLNHFICASTSVHSTLSFSSYDFIMFTPRKLLVANITIIVYIGSTLYDISFPPRMYICVFCICMCQFFLFFLFKDFPLQEYS